MMAKNAFPWFSLVYGYLWIFLWTFTHFSDIYGYNYGHEHSITCHYTGNIGPNC